MSYAIAFAASFVLACLIAWTIGNALELPPLAIAFAGMILGFLFVLRSFIWIRERETPNRRAP
jgi:hypothetical protein